ncbi:MAG TPA: ABC transporter ATP-binding protein [Ktedonobacteraceae bacterium]|nr:ABC transporter ATP-binding protein [Ktedonobacteraceae bacterium]
MIPLPPARLFPYTAQKGPYLSILGAFLFLTISEGTLYVFLILRFVPTALWQTVILVLIGGFLVVLFGKLSYPLWTAHRLWATELELHYGFDIHARVPLSQLVSAQSVHERPAPFAVPRYDATRKRLMLAFSERGQVLLCLKHPIFLRLRLHVRLVEQLLINLDDRTAFLTALKLLQTEPPTVDERPKSRSVISTPRELPQVAATAPPMISAIGLTRSYADVTAVNDLHLVVRQGEIYGFLGPNGAGKSTTISMLVGLLRPTAGRAELSGHDVWCEPLQAKRVLGYMADRALLYERLSGREMLAFLGQLRGLSLSKTEERSAFLLDLLELTGAAERLCGSYSFGMKRKLALAAALLHEPAILILDEPLNGLDPLSVRRMKDLFIQLAASSTTILLSTHDLASVQEICQRIGILHQGHLLAEGSLAELRTRAEAPDLERVFLRLTSQSEEMLQ